MHDCPSTQCDMQNSKPRSTNMSAALLSPSYTHASKLLLLPLDSSYHGGMPLVVSSSHVHSLS